MGINFYNLVSGSSGNPCSNEYEGPQPFSEVECKQMAAHVRSIKHKLQVMIYVFIKY